VRPLDQSYLIVGAHREKEGRAIILYEALMIACHRNSENEEVKL
jgi:hypothetical protein